MQAAVTGQSQTQSSARASEKGKESHAKEQKEKLECLEQIASPRASAVP